MPKPHNSSLRLLAGPHSADEAGVGDALLPRVGFKRNAVHNGDATPVGVLLDKGRPATVARLVPSAPVDAIQGSPRRAFSHVSQEDLEARPSVADGNAPAAIVGVVRASRVAASRLHGRPDLISWTRRLARSLRLAVLPASPEVANAPAASAALGGTPRPANVGRAPLDQRATVAAYLPDRPASVATDRLKHGERPLATAAQINVFRHTRTLMEHGKRGNGRESGGDLGRAA